MGMTKDKLIKAIIDCKNATSKYGLDGAYFDIKIIDRIIEELTEEEAEVEIEGGGSTWWYVGSDCHGAINDFDRYCRHCGRRLKRA